jgi:hypothetical protein
MALLPSALPGNIFHGNGKLLASDRYLQFVYLWPMAHTHLSRLVVVLHLDKILKITDERSD